MFFGCNCKNKSNEQPNQKVVQVNDQVEIMSEPLYLPEEVDRIENWLNSTSKTLQETHFVINFNKLHFGESIIGYCDIPCQHRIRKRVESMREKLRLYGTK